MWLRIDDNLPDHPKFAALDPTAGWLWLLGLCYCGRLLTDGKIPKAVAAQLAARVTGQQSLLGESELIGKLVSVGLWIAKSGGYQVHDYLHHNPSRADIMAERRWAKKRREIYADRELVDALRTRDQDRCRYCGKRVSWTDRRGPNGATFDHIRPRGPATLENLVVACRACNSAKGDRTLARSGMRLLPVDSRFSGTSSELVPELEPNKNVSSPVPSRPVLSTTSTKTISHPENPIGLLVDAYRALPGVVASPKDGGVVAGQVTRYGPDLVRRVLETAGTSIGAADHSLPYFVRACQFEAERQRTPTTVQPAILAEPDMPQEELTANRERLAVMVRGFRRAVEGIVPEMKP